jgi:nucleoside-diphosphate-sugar epimerase
MRVFVTGATGFIGSAIVQELIGAGHQALGLARSDAGAKSLIAAGAQVHRGDLQDLESLRSGAAKSDAVIHTGFIHDFSNFAKNCEIDKRAIEALGSALKGSERPLLVTSGLATVAQGRMSTEEDAPLAPSASYPRASEVTAEALLQRGVRVSVVRLPQVHNTVKQGLVTYAIAMAREKGVSAYVGDGRNRWAAVHVLDAARLYRLALEKQEAGARYHAVAEEGVPVRDIADAIGRGLKVPLVSKSAEEAAAHFGFLGMFVSRDLIGSSVQTQRRLGWRPTGPGLITDLDRAHYFAAEQTA